MTTRNGPTRNGPRRIVELDGIPIAHWPIDYEHAVFAWKGKLWTKEKVGCVLCTEKLGPEFMTLCATDEAGREHFHCVEHGSLVEIPYSMRKTFVIVIADVSREGEETLDDTMLFPAEMTYPERNALIESMLDEAEEAEHEAGAAPVD